MFAFYIFLGCTPGRGTRKFGKNVKGNSSSLTNCESLFEMQNNTDCTSSSSSSSSQSDEESSANERPVVDAVGDANLVGVMVRLLNFVINKYLLLMKSDRET